MNHTLITEAKILFSLLKKHNNQIVIAESCTGGLVAATLARLPGVSEYLCGSAVVYQEQTKTAWLGISAETIQQAGVVSVLVADKMARNVLQKTPHATIAASITGHLGPHAPPELDGVACIGIAHRNKQGAVKHATTTQHQLTSKGENDLRYRRQQESAELVIKQLCQFLQES